MRKDNINDRYRIYLGAKAKALTVAHCPPGELPGSDHLEAGIEALQQALEVERAVLRRLQDEFDRLDGRMVNLVSAHNHGLRGLMMMTGQMVRELNVIRKILIVSAASNNEQAERLYVKAVPAIMEMRATLAVWREREGLEVPEFSFEQEERILQQLVQNPAEHRHPDHGEEPETLGEALAEQVQRIGEAFDPSLTDERHEREMEMGDDER
ncbi:hypothetical protein ACN9JG_22930 (plasmid) [Cereibacter azotoformans]|uniref:hypothetical protein n=1 Tax=Cereibacter azotoformans TaxID=43057 RepID=UPI003B22884F